MINARDIRVTPTSDTKCRAPSGYHVSSPVDGAAVLDVALSGGACALVLFGLYSKSANQAGT